MMQNSKRFFQKCGVTREAGCHFLAHMAESCRDYVEGLLSLKH